MNNIITQLELTGSTHSQSSIDILSDIPTGNIEHLIKGSSSVSVPTTLPFVLKRYISKKDLKKIHPNKEVAIELIMIIVSNLSMTWYSFVSKANKSFKEQENAKWKRLNWEIMRDQVGYAKNTYKIIIEVLKKGTKKNGPIIIVDERFFYGTGGHSRAYKLAPKYFGIGIKSVELKTKLVLSFRHKSFYKMLSEATENKIGRSQIAVLGRLNNLTEEQINKRAKELVAKGYFTSKGLQLKFKNGHSKSRFTGKYSFVEDAILIWKQLIDNNGFMVPVIGGESSGGRVAHSLNLLPNWIREMFTIDDEEIVANDYSALHPNLANKIYGGTGEHISHDKVASTLNIERQVAKIEHLSFFNKEWKVEITTEGYAPGLYDSPLFNYYAENETKMMENMWADKKENGYKVTSRKMFKLETEIMTSNIIKLNSLGISVIYVYDALYSKKSDAAVVKKIMNETAKEFGVNTHC